MIFSSIEDGAPRLYRKRVPGNSPDVAVVPSLPHPNMFPTDWSRDGRWVLYSAPGTAWDVFALRMDNISRPGGRIALPSRRAEPCPRGGSRRHGARGDRQHRRRGPALAARGSKEFKLIYHTGGANMVKNVPVAPGLDRLCDVPDECSPIRCTSLYPHRVHRNASKETRLPHVGEALLTMSKAAPRFRHLHRRCWSVLEGKRTHGGAREPART